MKKLKVIKIENDIIHFEDGYKLFSEHISDCCEHHELTLTDITMQDFEGLEFDLSTDAFFRRIDGYGIELVPVHGHSVRIPGHGYNNGYYSSLLDLIVTNEKDYKAIYDITICQYID